MPVSCLCLVVSKAVLSSRYSLLKLKEKINLTLWMHGEILIHLMQSFAKHENATKTQLLANDACCRGDINFLIHRNI